MALVPWLCEISWWELLLIYLSYYAQPKALEQKVRELKQQLYHSASSIQIPIQWANYQENLKHLYYDQGQKDENLLHKVSWRFV